MRETVEGGVVWGVENWLIKVPGSGTKIYSVKIHTCIAFVLLGERKSQMLNTMNLRIKALVSIDLLGIIILASVMHMKSQARRLPGRN